MKWLYLHTGRIESSEANLVQTIQMAQALGTLGEEVTLAVGSAYPSDAKRDSILDEYVGTRARFELEVYQSSSFMGGLQGLGAVRPALELAAGRESDVIFLRNPTLAPLVYSSRGKVVFESHNTHSFDNVPFLDLYWRRKIIRRLRDGRISLLVAISEALANWWIGEGAPPERVCALHDGVSADFVPTELTRDRARAKLGIPSGQQYVVYTGSLYKDRGIEIVFRLARERTETYFLVVGGPDKIARSFAEKARASGLDNVTFYGRVAHRDVPLYLSAADVLLMLWSWRVKTIRYCSPLKLFEYMAAERIIVGQGFPTIHEVIEDGVHAYLSDPDSFDDLFKKLNQALDSPDTDMAKRAHDRVLDKYTWTKRCEYMVNLLETIP